MSKYDGPERRSVPKECIIHSEILHDLVKDIADLKVMTKQTHTIVTGNGDPTNGILFRVAENTQFRRNVSQRLDKLVWLIIAVGLTSIIPQALSYAAKVMGNG